MALTDENGSGMVMPVQPMYGNGNGNGMGWGGDGWWIILLFLLAGNGMWGGFGGMNGFGAGLGIDFPWILNGQNGINNNVSDGFRDAQLHDSVTSVRDGISSLATQLCGCCGDIQNSLCSGFAGVTASVNNAQNAIAQQMYGNTIADLERSFAAQTASTQGMNAIQAQLAQCCCDNRAATADLKYTIATENCADRAAISDGIRDLLTAQTANTQRILDQLCQDKIDAKNDEIATLRQQIAMKDLAASQLAQNNFIAQGFSNEVDALYNRLNSCPVPTTPVYGRTPIFTCNQNSGCGCGCNGGF
jgi:hypothetical protein